MQARKMSSGASGNIEKILGFLIFVGISGIIFGLPLAVWPGLGERALFSKIIFFEDAVALLALLFLFYVWKRGAVTLKKNLISSLAIIFFLTTVMSASFSLLPRASLFGSPGRFSLNCTVILFFILWFFLLSQVMKKKYAVDFLAKLFLLSGSLASVVFLATSLSKPAGGQINLSNAVSSGLGVYLAAIATVAVGLLSDKTNNGKKLILPGLAFFVSVATILRLGFTLPWIILAVGIGTLIIVSFLNIRSCRVKILPIIFLFFLASVSAAIFGTPVIVKTVLAPEVSLGPGVSWQITWSAVSQSVKSLLIGTGLGTFGYNYDLYKPAALNLVELAWALQISAPIGTAFSIFSDIGFVGLAIFVSLIIANSFYSLRYILQKKDNPTLFGGAVFAAWAALTVAFFVTNFDFVLWWAWWSLMAFCVLSCENFTKRHSDFVSIKFARTVSVTVLAYIVLVFGAYAAFVVLLGNFYSLRAESNYVRALASQNKREAINNFIAANVAVPSNPEYELGLSFACSEIGRLKIAEADSRDEAVNYLAEAVKYAKLAAENDPKNFMNWQALGEAYLNVLGFTDKSREWALDSFHKALSLNPNNPKLKLWLGFLAESANNLAEAKKYYKEAIVLKPDYLPAYVNLSGILEREKKLDAAINVFEPVFAQVVRNPDALYNLGRLFYNRNAKGDQEKAESLWTEVLKLRPDHSNTLFSLGLLAEKNRNIAKANEYYRRVKELNPNNQEIIKKINSLNI